MTKKDNFKWLADDINNTLVLKVMSIKDDGEEFYGVFNVSDVLNTTGDELEIETANIDDLTNLLTLGLVRFVNVSDSSDVLDIPFRKLYKLYENANVLGEEMKEKLISFKELEFFSVIDGLVREDFMIYSAMINKIPDELNEVMKIAYEFDGYSMQERFDALSKIMMINHRRLVDDEKK